MAEEQAEGWASIETAARKLDLSVSEVEDLIRSGELTGAFEGETWWLDPEVLDDAAARRIVARSMGVAISGTASDGTLWRAEPGPGGSLGVEGAGVERGAAGATPNGSAGNGVGGKIARAFQNLFGG